MSLFIGFPIDPREGLKLIGISADDTEDDSSNDSSADETEDIDERTAVELLDNYLSGHESGAGIFYTDKGRYIIGYAYPIEMPCSKFKKKLTKCTQKLMKLKQSFTQISTVEICPELEASERVSFDELEPYVIAWFG